MITNSLRVLLSEIIDYAGLFPPSQVPMQTAVKNFADYLKGENSWMLGRFIVPFKRFDEFIDEGEKHFTKKNPWRVSLLVNNNLAKSLKRIDDFNSQFDGRAKIDTLEIKVKEASEITDAAKILPADFRTYFEIPPSDVLTSFLTALAITKHGAKLRAGGITVDAFPSTDAIIKFMRICIAANVPFKATAGLHHPLRCVKPLTYEPEPPIGAMNGFLNLFLSACILRQDLNNATVHRLMNDPEAASFSFGEDEITWGNQTVPLQTLSLTRMKNALSFGSCSFLEPIEDLQEIGLM